MNRVFAIVLMYIFCTADSVAQHEGMLTLKENRVMRFMTYSMTNNKSRNEIKGALVQIDSLNAYGEIIKTIGFSWDGSGVIRKRIEKIVSDKGVNHTGWSVMYDEKGEVLDSAELKYNEYGWFIKSITRSSNGDTSKETREFDAYGNLVVVNNYENDTLKSYEKNEYDDNGDLRKNSYVYIIESPEGSTDEIENVRYFKLIYKENGKVDREEVSNEDGLVVYTHKYTYDKFERVISIRIKNKKHGRKTRQYNYKYDKSGNLIKYKYKKRLHRRSNVSSKKTRNIYVFQYEFY